MDHFGESEIHLARLVNLDIGYHDVDDVDAGMASQSECMETTQVVRRLRDLAPCSVHLALADPVTKINDAADTHVVADVHVHDRQLLVSFGRTACRSGARRAAGFALSA